MNLITTTRIKVNNYKNDIRVDEKEEWKEKKKRLNDADCVLYENKKKKKNKMFAFASSNTTIQKKNSKIV